MVHSWYDDVNDLLTAFLLSLSKSALNSKIILTDFK